MTVIDVNETGPCRIKSCKRTGKRAHGARDIAGFKSRNPGVFDEKSFYCDEDLTAAAQRSFTRMSLGVQGGLQALMWRNDDPAFTLPGRKK